MAVVVTSRSTAQKRTAHSGFSIDGDGWEGDSYLLESESEPVSHDQNGTFHERSLQASGKQIPSARKTFKFMRSAF